MDREIISSVEAALSSKGVSVAQFCRRADVAQTTWQRLKQGATNGLRKGTMERLRASFTELTGREWPAVREAA